MPKISKPPGIDDVARKASVSISTVSRVINRTVPVSNEIVERVEAFYEQARARFLAEGGPPDRELSTADWVRPGIMLYGCSPFADRAASSLGLRPVMTLASELISVRRLQRGERVGYGFSYEAAQAMTIGVVACGYADGYPRHAPSGTPVLVNGQRARTVGRVSMDMIAIDLSALRGVGVGTPVTLWGEGLSADEVGAAAGTLSYELFTKLTARVPVLEVP